MANELEILTENAAGTSWVDVTPDAVSTGYQAQNTNIEGNRNGDDKSYVYYDSGTDEIVIPPSGPIDVNGLPFSVSSEVRLSNPGAGTWYIRVIDGADATQKSLEFTSSKGTWDASKNALYDTSGNRVLNWVFESVNGSQDIYRLMPIDVVTNRPVFTNGFLFENNNNFFMNLDSLTFTPIINIYDSFSSPSSSIFGSVIDTSTGNLITCNETSPATIYIHDGVSSSILSSFSAPVSPISGVTYDSSTGNLISCSYSSGLVYIHDGVSSSILSSFSSPGSSRDITIDKSTGNLITNNSVSTIYIHDGISASTLTSFSSPDSNIIGLAYDELTGNLISSDGGTDTIYIHDGVSSSIFDSFAGQNTSPRGLGYSTFDGRFIEPDASSNTIYIHKRDIYYNE